MIREVREADCREITEIYNYYVANSIATFDTIPVTEQQMLDNIRNISADYPYYIYEIDGTIAGYCYAHSWKNEKSLPTYGGNYSIYSTSTYG